MNPSMAGLLIGLVGFHGSVAQDATPEDPTQVEDPDVPWIDWCSSLITALADEDAAAFKRLVDMDAVLDRAFQGIDCPKSYATGFRAGVAMTVSGSQGIYGVLTAALAKEARFEFLRLRGDAQARTALFRFVPPTGEMNYLEFTLDRKEDGSIRASDIYVVRTGESVSSMSRRNLISIAAGRNRDWFGRLSGSEAALVEHSDAIKQVTKAAEQGDVESFARLITQLPPELLSEKSIILMRVQVFCGEDPHCVQAVADLRRHHPDDPCTLVKSIYYFWNSGEHSAALEEVERLRLWVGGDPYLHLLRAQILGAAKDYDQAKSSARKAIDEGLGWIDPYWTVLAATLSQERFEETLATLREIDAEFQMEWSDMTEVAAYAGFVKSPQHAQWLEHLRSNSAPR